MDTMQIAAQLFKSQLDKDKDGKIEISDIISAVSSLMGNESGKGAKGLLSIVSNMQNGGDSILASLAASWLGSGDNASVSSNQLLKMFGENKIAEFSNKLGISKEKAIDGLQKMVPEFIDKSSPNGTLNDMFNSNGESQGLSSTIMGIAKNFLKK